ncbi:MAG: hypothetical protein Q9O62_12580 [Ardenticatenia bacterium]|nr:hypothetical protein [Ardenticatenia bacterium]
MGARGVRGTRRDLLMGMAMAAGLVTWVLSSNNTFRLPGVMAWWTAVAAWLAAWWDGEPTLPRPKPRAGQGGYLTAAAAILLLGALFRFYHLESIPPEMTSDHAEKLLDVRDVLEGARPIFFPRNTGREPAQFYVTALIAGPLGFGLSHMALKFGTALIGWLTLPLIMWAVRWGGGYSRRVTLLTGLLVAMSKWHVSITRVGLRFPYTPLASALTLGFLWRAMCSSADRYWVLTGLALGFGLYGYTASRILPLVVLVGLGIWGWRVQASSWAGRWYAVTRAGLLMALSAGLAFLPLLRFSLERPDLFWYRSMTRVAGGIAEPSWSTFFLNVRNALLMFHVRGDVVWVNGVPEDPALDRVTGLLFLVGLVVLAARLIRHPVLPDALVLTAWPLLLLPSILALAWPNENPSLVRTSGAIPVVMLIAALGTDALWQRLARLLGPWPVRLGMMMALAVALVLNWRTYFTVYPRIYAQASWNSTEIAAEIERLAPAVGGVDFVYIFSYPHWVDTRNVAFNMGVPDWNRVLFEVSEIEDASPEVRAIIFHPADVTNRQGVFDLWPGACRWVVPSRTPGKEFIVVVRPPYCERLKGP